MVFKIKREDFKCKVRLVVGGHMTKATVTFMYPSVVSKEIVKIAVMLANLNDLDVKLGDILNAYILAPVTEKGVNNFLS